MPQAESVTAAEKYSRELVNWLASFQISYSYKTDNWLHSPLGEAPRVFSWQDVHDFVTTTGPGRLTKNPSRIAAVMRRWARSERDQFICKFQESMLDWIPERREGQRLWEEWIHAVCGDGHELSLVVMQHWVWLVRRKMASLPVHDHICPIVYGCSGSGKSVEMRTFIDPLDPLVSEQTLPQLTDERHWVELARHYIIYLDELAGARKADRDTLKFLITTPHVYAHVFHTQRREHVPQNASLLGTSNRPVSEIILDATSGRRYWELRARSPRLDWNTLSKMDRHLLWGAVSPDRPSPLNNNSKLKQEIQTLQHTHLRTVPPLEIWLAEINLTPGDKKVPMSRVYETYCAWCGDVREAPLGKIAFAKGLKAQGFQRCRFTKGERGTLLNKLL